MKKCIYALFLMITSCNLTNHVIRKQTKVIANEFLINYSQSKTIESQKINLSHHFLFIQLEELKENSFYNKNASYILKLALPVLHNEKYFKGKVNYTFEGFQTYYSDTVYGNKIIRKLFSSSNTYIDTCNSSSLSFYDGFPNWTIAFNKNNEILQIFPQKDTALIRGILEAKGLKFAATYGKY